MSSTVPASAPALIRQTSFLFFLLSRSLSRFSSQIAGVAIGWQVYDLTGSAFDLGMVGLVQFLPTAPPTPSVRSSAQAMPRTIGGRIRQ